MHLGIFLAGMVALVIGGCSSSPRSVNGEPEPPWIHQASRTIDAGYIVYIGVGEDRTLEGARFKAEGMAIQDLANECSLAPKGARVEDRYDEVAGNVHRSYAKIGIVFEECEEAKKAVEPDAIRAEANVELTDELKRYQDTVAQAETNPPPVEGSSPGASSASSAGPAIRPAYMGPSVIVASSDYYVARQQVVYAKETVILAPPQAYPPGAPQTTQFVAAMRAPTEQINHYEMANPQIRSSPTTWSTLPNRPATTMPQALRQQSRSAYRPSAGAPRPSAPAARRAPRQGRKRRRRW